MLFSVAKCAEKVVVPSDCERTQYVRNFLVPEVISKNDVERLFVVRASDLCLLILSTTKDPGLRSFNRAIEYQKNKLFW